MIDLLKNIDLDNLNFFDQGFLASYDLEQVSKSLLHVHLPSNDDEIWDSQTMDPFNITRWHKSIIFFEFLILCLGLKEKNSIKEIIQGGSHGIVESNSLYIKIKNDFPFDLTDSQNKVLTEILHDMNSVKQMNRLLQGDVSSGKTIIALLSMAVSYDNNYQSAMQSKLNMKS